MTQNNKPLKTHQNEIVLCPLDETIKCYQYTAGITVDPVRIPSLREFGTPEQVADKIAASAKSRDGVFSITLDALSEFVDSNGLTYYDVAYTEVGKRGTKSFSTRTLINNGRLFVFTGSVKPIDVGEERIEQMKLTRDSFRVQF